MLPVIAFLVTSVLAQSSLDLYSQYVQAGNAYRTAYSSYTKAKNQYVQYHTASTRTDAINFTQQVLENRNSWQISYLKFLRQTLSDVTQIANYPQTTVYLNLETEITALGSTKFDQEDSFPKLNIASLNWQNRLKSSDTLTTTAILQISSARLANFQNQLAAFIPSDPSPQHQSTIKLITDKLTASIALREKNNLSKSDLSASLVLLQDAARLLSEISQAP